MKKLLLLFSIPIFFYSWQINLTDKKLPEKIASSLQYWNENFPQEKVFLQLDKKQYVAGEEIWFKASCTFNNKPTFLSRIIYVDIINDKGLVIDKKMYKLDSLSSCYGSLVIDKKLISGNYSINAYTLWMLNYPDFIAKNSVFIYGTDYTKKIYSKVEQTIKVNFFPEGGNIVAGIKNRIAFKITDQFGFPLDLSGTIVNGSNGTVANFNSKHDGMGFFELEPVTNETYSAIINTTRGVELSFKLPTSFQEGVTLSIQNTKNRFFALVNRGEKNNEKYNNLLLAAHINGQLVYMGAFDFNDGKTAATVPKKNLPPGIIHFTLFDTSATPLAERLAFNENYLIHQPVINFQKKDLTKRGENKLVLTLDSVSLSNVSVLIKNGDIDNAINRDDNIASTFLLTSDIKGVVNNAGYYFANKADTTLQNLDLLLMTHGWRRFLWKDVIAKNDPKLKYPIESNISIKGKVTKSDRKEIVKDGKVSFIIKGEDSTKILADAYLTDKGEFILDSINFRQKATVFYEGQNNKKEKLPVDIHVYTAYIDSLKQSSLISVQNLDTADIANRKNSFTQSIYNQIAFIDTISFGNTTLAGVTVRAKKLSRIDSLQKAYVSTVFEYSDNTIDFVDAKGMTNIWQYLRMQISGFEVDPFVGGGSSARFTRNDGIRGLSEDPSAGNQGIMFMLNEIEVSPEFLDNLNPDDVAIVKVYKGNTAFAWGATNGMIAVYTKKGVSLSSPFQKSFTKMEIQGYANSAREFFSPNYSKYPTLNANKTDRRQTLYWNPNLKKQKDGSFTIHFFNNDITNKFKLVIQGIDKDGQLIHLEQIIQ